MTGGGDQLARGTHTLPGTGAVDHLVRPSESHHALDGLRPPRVARPETVEEVAEVMKLAARRGWSVAPRGSGTKMGLGAPPEAVDLLLDLSGLNRVLEHAAGDLVASAEAGVRLSVLQERLAAAGQMLALDPPGGEGTLGGIIATNASGPRRLRYGTVRDLLIGVTVVLADGTVAKAGGKVVKNVAGYDLAKLITGSLGTLGVIVRATFRLYPQPPAARLVEVTLDGPGAVERATLRVLASKLVPSAVQLAPSAAGRARIGVLFEGIGPSVAAQAAATAALLEGGAKILAGPEADEAWSTLAPWPPPTDAVEIQVTCLPSRLAATLHAARTATEVAGEGWHLHGMPASGILLLRHEAPDADAVVRVVERLRARPEEGHVVILTAPTGIRRRIDPWGPVGNSLELMRRVKARFDPDRLLNPGRFVGGI